MDEQAAEKTLRISGLMRRYAKAAGREIPPGKRGRPLRGTAPGLEELSRLYAQGKTAEEIGRAYGVSQDTILRRLEKHGLRARQSLNKLKDYTLEDLQGCVDQEGAVLAAARLGVDRKTLYRNLRKLGKRRE